MEPDNDLDLEQAARLLGDAALVPLVVRAFATSVQTLLPRMRQCIADDQVMEVRRHLHRLTPTLALLASRGLQDDCAQVSALWHAAGTAERQPRSLALVDRIDRLAQAAGALSDPG